MYSLTMPAYAALLRSVNVGGTGKLAMSDLTTLCTQAGFAHAKTYIASGNVVFTSPLPEPPVKAALETRLATHAGKPIGVLLRTAAELARILAADPFPHAAGNQLLILFLDTPPTRRPPRHRSPPLATTRTSRSPSAPASSISTTPTGRAKAASSSPPPPATATPSPNSPSSPQPSPPDPPDYTRPVLHLSSRPKALRSNAAVERPASPRHETRP